MVSSTGRCTATEAGGPEPRLVGLASGMEPCLAARPLRAGRVFAERPIVIHFRIGTAGGASAHLDGSVHTIGSTVPPASGARRG